MRKNNYYPHFSSNIVGIS